MFLFLPCHTHEIYSFEDKRSDQPSPGLVLCLRAFIRNGRRSDKWDSYQDPPPPIFFFFLFNFVLVWFFFQCFFVFLVVGQLFFFGGEFLLGGGVVGVRTGL